MQLDASQVSLVVAAAAFAAFMVWRFRPAVDADDEAGGDDDPALRARIERATTPAERARALCDAADARARQVGRVGSAAAYYLRAMRADPTSVDVVDRAAAGLARRPRALEQLLWRRLGAEPWSGAGKAAARSAAEHLARLYAGPLRSAVRARALERAAAALE